MSSVAERLKNLRVLSGKSQEDVAKEIGVSRQTIFKYEQGIITNIPIKNIKKLSQVYGSTPAYITGWEDKKDTDLSKISNIIQLKKIKKIAILGSISCGSPAFSEENIQGYVNVDDTIKADFCLYASGNSMIDANIYNNDLVFFKKATDIQNGKIGAFLIDNEATLKKFYRTDNGVILQACNPKYPPIVYSCDEEVKLLGVMVAVLSERNE